MSARSMLERLRVRVQAASDDELAYWTGLSFHTLRQILQGKIDRRRGLTLDTLHRISQASETPIGMLAEWWAQPEDEGLKAAAQSAALG